MPPRDRLATTPISWGFVGGGRWGVDLPTDRVLGEMAALGFAATEAGVPAFLPTDVGAARALLDEHGLRAVAAAQPFVAHEPSQAAEAIAAARAGAARLQALGADVMMTVPKRGDLPVGQRLDASGWRHVFDVFARVDDVLADFGLRQALHPHVDSLVETAEDMTTVLEGCDVGWCFDTAHVASGGMDPVAFASECPTINHVHLKDAHIELGRQMVDHEVGFAEAIRARVFVPLGEGDLPIADIVSALEGRDDVWWVLEQDQAVVDDGVPGPAADVVRSLAFLERLAGSDSGT